MANPAGFDPQGAAIEPRAAEPALPEQALVFEYLEKLFHRARTEPNFPNWSPELLHDRRSPEGPLAEQAPIAASVLIPLIGQAPSVLLTRRTSGLSSHAGQISFPGGRAETRPHCARPMRKLASCPTGSGCWAGCRTTSRPPAFASPL